MTRATIYIDQDGDLKVNDVFTRSVHSADTYKVAGLDTDTEYEVDTVPFEGASYLEKAGYIGTSWTSYTAEADETLQFCNRRLKETFGEIPQRIYYKEV